MEQLLSELSSLWNQISAIILPDGIWIGLILIAALTIPALKRRRTRDDRYRDWGE